MSDKNLPGKLSEDILKVNYLSTTTGEKLRPFSREIHLLHTKVNGMMHVKEIRKRASHLKKGDRLKLVLEPDNKYDEKAILVKNNRGGKIGYIPRMENEILYNLMNAGKELYAVVDDGVIGKVALDERIDFISILIDVYMID
jgi:hypothetical protein